MRPRTTTAALALAGTALAGCSDDRGSAAPPAPDDGAASTTAAGATAGRTAGGPTLEELQAAVRDGDTGRGTNRTQSLGLTTTSTSTFRLSDAAATTLTSTLSFPSTTSESVVVGDDGYVQFRAPAVSMDKCWIASDVRDLGAVDGGVHSTDEMPGAPSELAALLNAEQDGDAVTLDLFTAASILGPRVRAPLGVVPDPAVRVPVSLTTGDRSVTTSWTLTDVLDAAEAAGLDVPAELRDGAEATRFRGTVSAPGSAVRIEPPPPDRRIPSALEPDAKAVEVESCEAR